jgi:L-arabinose isomerase
MKNKRLFVKVSGIVQGVGFRPFVYNLACSLKLKGWVNNNSEGVHIDIEGSPEDISTFIYRLKHNAPPLSRIDDISTEEIDSVKVQARYDIAFDKFIDTYGISAFTDTFQDLFGLQQLPGLAVQRQMAKGIGFGAEGDYKTACLNAVLNRMAEGRKGGTGFMEDYTYDLTEGDELVLAAHMLEVSPEFASTKPKIEVHPLGIGGKKPPARLVFEGIQGDAKAVCMTDMGDRFRLICAEIELVRQPNPMPNLPVARLMWKLKPDFKSGVKAWLEAGGGHHTVVSTALTSADIEMFAKLTDTEIILIR